ncbi:MAG: YebC/PmpR family DNA-binding transcriptional regulator [Candidatus Omnitrophica bacterium]|nr:YebC/PmpR family DNA-binding transcriptional regulator [Candidatus Omnitrophota bacterium]
MSGHSKWHSIKHKKAAEDAKRGKIFTKVIKELTIAARVGGGSPETNPRLRTAILKAKASNMPQDNIERAIKKGTGELPGVSYEEVTYEGYAQGGVAIMVEVTTDNKNRTTAELRNLFSKRGGNMAGAGSVAWQFQKKGYILISKDAASEETIMNIAIDAGAEDVKGEGDEFEIITEMNDFETVKKAFEDKNVEIKTADLTMIPNTTIKIDDLAQAKSILAMVESFEEHDDVQNVYANFDIPDDILTKLSES